MAAPLNPDPHGLIDRMPSAPGVYLFKNAAAEIIYIGKAKNLRVRVASYFRRQQDAKTEALVHHARDIDYIVTESEYEALLLEINLIKQWRPRFNIELKDDKSYPVIRITAEKYPRVFKTRRIVRDGSRYFGPFVQGLQLDRYLDLVERLYPLRKCRGPLRPRPHPCLYFHIGRCSSPCSGRIDHEQYMRHIAAIEKMLAGDTSALKQKLHRQIATSSEALQFEKASEYRDALVALKQLEWEQNVVDFDPESRDYIGYAEHDRMALIALFKMRSGRLVTGNSFYVRALGSGPENISQFILQYYERDVEKTAQLFVPFDVDNNQLERYFRRQHSRTLAILTPTGKRDRAIMRLVAENARHEIERRERAHSNRPAVEELQRALQLTRAPMRIEGFDIAHIAGKHTVAAMVAFQEGIPDRQSYRRYRIRSLEDGRIDDFEAMREVVARRYTRLLNEKLPLPDLILVDGGRGQVAAAVGVIKALELGDIALLGLAKRNEELFLPHQSEPVILPQGSAPLRLLQYVRDEAHRFCTGYRTRLQERELRPNQLTALSGIGPTRAGHILRQYGSLEALAAAAPQDIAHRCSLGAELAATLSKWARDLHATDE